MLLGFGLVLLVISEFRHSSLIRRGIWKEDIPAEEIAREGQLRAYWMVMNSAILLLVGFWYSSSGGSCSAHPRDASGALFLYGFGAVALLRDILDFRWAWPFLYPMANPVNQVLPPLTWMTTPGRRTFCILLGGAIILLDGWVLYVLKLWDFPHWSAYCS